MIVKTFKLTEEEYQTLLEMMAQANERNFSNFIRQRLFQTKQPDTVAINTEEHSVSTLTAIVLDIYWKQHQELEIVRQLERIFLTLYQIQVLAETSNQLAHEHMKKVMECFRELLSEADREMDLSEEFKEKWL